MVSFINSEIEFYVDKYQPYDKAGHMQSGMDRVVGIQRINGDFIT
jgi:predicted house-cleaning NTP pyrophosphatase (Maf/HAM1 superfamily)